MEEETKVSEVKPPKKNNTTLLLCIIIVALLCVIGGLIVMNMNKDNKKDNQETKENKNDEKKDEEEEKKEEEEEIPDYRPSDPKYPTVVEEAQALLPFGICGYPAFPFEKKDLTINDLDDDTKIRMVIHRYASYDPEKVERINSREITRYFDDVSFLDKLKTNGTTVELAPSSIKYVGDNAAGDSEFELSSYPTGCEGAYEGEVLEKTKFDIKDDVLTLTYADYWATYDYEKEYYTFYKDENKTVAYDKVNWDQDKGKFVIDGKPIDYNVFNKYILSFDLKDDHLRLTKVHYEEAK